VCEHNDSVQKARESNLAIEMPRKQVSTMKSKGKNKGKKNVYAALSTGTSRAAQIALMVPCAKIIVVSNRAAQIFCDRASMVQVADEVASIRIQMHAEVCDDEKQMERPAAEQALLANVTVP
jgi:hypothetical protein